MKQFKDLDTIETYYLAMGGFLSIDNGDVVAYNPINREFNLYRFDFEREVYLLVEN